MTTTTTMVADKSGALSVPADLLATFTEYLQGVAYQFTVTREQFSTAPVKLTHKKSGFSMGEVTPTTLSAARGDYKAAGKLALRSIIEAKGEARVASAVRAKE